MATDSIKQGVIISSPATSAPSTSGLVYNNGASTGGTKAATGTGGIKVAPAVTTSPSPSLSPSSNGRTAQSATRENFLQTGSTGFLNNGSGMGLPTVNYSGIDTSQPITTSTIKNNVTFNKSPLESLRAEANANAASDAQRRSNDLYFDYHKKYSAAYNRMDNPEGFEASYNLALAKIDREMKATKDAQERQALQWVRDDFVAKAASAKGAGYVNQAYNNQKEMDEAIDMVFSPLYESSEYQAQVAAGRELARTGKAHSWLKGKTDGLSDKQKNLIYYALGTGGLDEAKRVWDSFLGDSANYMLAANDFYEKMNGKTKSDQGWATSIPVGLLNGVTGQFAQGMAQSLSMLFGGANPEDGVILGDYTVANYVDGTLKNAIGDIASSPDFALGKANFSSAKGTSWYNDALESASEFQKQYLGYVYANYGDEVAGDVWMQIKQMGDEAWQLINGSQTKATNESSMFGNMVGEYKNMDGSAKLPEWLVGDDATTVGRMAWDAAVTTGAMLPQVGLTLAASFVAPGAATYLGSALMATQVFGNAYKTEMDNGATKEQALGYATAQAVIEFGVGALLDGAAGQGGVLVRKMGGAAFVENIANPWIKALTKLGISAAGEGAEEGIQELLDPIIRNWLLDEENEVGTNGSEAAYSFLLGAISAVAMSGVNTSVEAQIGKQRATIGAAIKAEGAKDKLVDTVSNNKPGSMTKEQAKAYDEAIKLAEDMKSGYVKDTDQNVGELLAKAAQAGVDINFLTSPSTVTYTKENLGYDDYMAGATSMLTALNGEVDNAPALAKMALGQEITAEEQSKIDADPKSMVVAEQLKGELNMDEDTALTRAARASTIKGAVTKVYQTLMNENPDKHVASPIEAALLEQGVDVKKASRTAEILNKVQDGIEISEREAGEIDVKSIATRGVILEKLDVDLKEYSSVQAVRDQLNAVARTNQTIKEQQAGLKQGAAEVLRAKAAAARNGGQQYGQENTPAYEGRNTGNGGQSQSRVPGEVGETQKREPGRVRQTDGGKRSRNADNSRGTRGQLKTDEYTDVEKATQSKLANKGFTDIGFISGENSASYSDPETGLVRIKVDGQFTEDQYANHEGLHLDMYSAGAAVRNAVVDHVPLLFGEDYEAAKEVVEYLYRDKYLDKPAEERERLIHEEMLAMAMGEQDFPETQNHVAFAFSMYTDDVTNFLEGFGVIGAGQKRIYEDSAAAPFGMTAAKKTETAQETKAETSEESDDAPPTDPKDMVNKILSGPYDYTYAHFIADNPALAKAFFEVTGEEAPVGNKARRAFIRDYWKNKEKAAKPAKAPKPAKESNYDKNFKPSDSSDYTSNYGYKIHFNGKTKQWQVKTAGAEGQLRKTLSEAMGKEGLGFKWAGKKGFWYGQAQRQDVIDAMNSAYGKAGVEPVKNVQYSTDDIEFGSDYDYVGWVTPDGETIDLSDNMETMHEDLYAQAKGIESGSIEDALNEGWMRNKPGEGVELNGDVRPTAAQSDIMEQIINNFEGETFYVDMIVNGAPFRAFAFTGAEIDPGHIYTVLKNYYARRAMDVRRDSFTRKASEVLGMPVKNGEDAVKMAQFFLKNPMISDEERVDLKALINEWNNRRFSSEDDEDVDIYMPSGINYENVRRAQANEVRWNEDGTIAGGEVDLSQEATTEDDILEAEADALLAKIESGGLTDEEVMQLFAEYQAKQEEVLAKQERVAALEDNLTAKQKKALGKETKATKKKAKPIEPPPIEEVVKLASEVEKTEPAKAEPEITISKAEPKEKHPIAPPAAAKTPTPTQNVFKKASEVEKTEAPVEEKKPAPIPTKAEYDAQMAAREGYVPYAVRSEGDERYVTFESKPGEEQLRRLKALEGFAYDKRTKEWRGPATEEEIRAALESREPLPEKKPGRKSKAVIPAASEVTTTKAEPKEKHPIAPPTAARTPTPTKNVFKKASEVKKPEPAKTEPTKAEPKKPAPIPTKAEYDAQMAARNGQLAGQMSLFDDEVPVANTTPARANEATTVTPVARTAEPENTKPIRFAGKDVTPTKKTGKWWERIGAADGFSIRKLRSDRNTYQVMLTDGKGRTVVYDDVSPSRLEQAIKSKVKNVAQAKALTANAMALAAEPGETWYRISNPAPVVQEKQTTQKVKPNRPNDSYGRKVSAKLADYMKDTTVRDENGALLPVYRLAAADAVRNARMPGSFSLWTARPAALNTYRGLEGVAAYGHSGKKKVEKRMNDLYEKLAKQDPKSDVARSIRAQIIAEERRLREYTSGVTRLDPYREAFATPHKEDIVEGRTLLEAYIDIQNPLEIDAEGNGLEWMEAKVKEIMDNPEYSEYDGIKFVNAKVVADGFTLGGEELDLDTAYVTFKNNQGKSTYNTDPSRESELMQYSMEEALPEKDVNGVALSEGQRAYFKDAKCIDDNGNLVNNVRELYHGSEAWGFEGFDLSRMDDGASIFLTDSAAVASSYAGSRKVRSLSEPTDPLLDELDNKTLAEKGLPIADYLDEMPDGGSELSEADVQYLAETYGKVFGKEVDAIMPTAGAKAKYQPILDEAMEQLKTLSHGAYFIQASGIKEANLETVVRMRKILFPLVHLSTPYSPNDCLRVSADLAQGLLELANNWKARIFIDEDEYPFFTDNAINEVLSAFGRANEALINTLPYFEKTDNTILEGDEPDEGWGNKIPFNTLVSALEDWVESAGKGKAIYPLYANITKPFVVDAEFSSWHEIPMPEEMFPPGSPKYESVETEDDEDEIESALQLIFVPTKTRDIAAYAKAQGYDGVIIKNVWDLGGRRDLARGESPYSNVYIAFKPEQTKDVYNTDPTSDPRFMYSMEDTGYTDGTLEDTIMKILADKDEERAMAALSEYVAQFMETGVLPAMEGPTTQNIFQPRVSGVTHQILRNQLDDLIKKNGRLDPGERAARDVYYPKATDNGNVRRVYRTAAEAKQTPERMVPVIDRAVVQEEAATYQTITNKAAIAGADRALRSKGYEGTLADWQGKIDVGKAPTKDDVALGEMLYIEAAKVGDAETAMRVLAELAEMATTSGQVVQAVSMLKRMPSSYQLYYFNRVVDRLNANYAKRINSGKMESIVIDRALAKAVLKAQSQDELNAAMDKLIEDIARQIPSTMNDKWNAWRYLSMLGNPKTHIRNCLGNAIFAPAKFAKDMVAAGLESRFIKDPNQRRTSFAGLLGINAGEYRAFAKEDFKGVKDQLTSGGKYSPSDRIMNARTIFKSKELEKLRRLNGDFLEKEDAWFLEKHYVNALTNFLTTRGMSLAELQSTREGKRVLNAARQYASQEALKATYRDASVVANALNQARRNVPVLGLLLDGVVPFTKTPINVLKRGMEYSPIGLLYTASVGTKRLKEGSITANDFIDGMAAGLTGTGIVAIGAWLASLGILRGGDDDDEKQQAFDELQGYQTYSITLGDKNFTIDWTAPVALPMFVGAELFKNFATDGELSNADWLNMLSIIAEPITQLSMLSGLSDALKSSQYDENPISSIVKTIGMDYIGQAFPTLLSQISRSLVADRRTSYVDKNKDMSSSMQRWIQTTIYGKTPLNAQRPKYIDAWGRYDTTSSVVARVFENMFSPAYINSIHTGPVEQELQRLSDKVGSGVLMTTPEKTLSWESKSYNLTAEQYAARAKARGDAAYTAYSRLFNSAVYKDLSDKEKANVVESIREYADYMGNKAVFPDYSNSDMNWIAKCDGDASRIENMSILKALAKTGGFKASNDSEFYGLIVESDWLDPVGQAYAIAQQLAITDQTVYLGTSKRKTAQYELTPERKQLVYDYYVQTFPAYYVEMVSDPRWAQLSTEDKVDTLGDLRSDVKGYAKAWLAQSLYNAGAERIG